MLDMHAFCHTACFAFLFVSCMAMHGTFSRELYMLTRELSKTVK